MTAAWDICWFVIAIGLGTTAVHSQECPTIPDVKSSFCDSLPSGCYKYPYDCHAYVSCNDSCADLEYCPGEKLFNGDLRICDTPEAVECTPLPYPTSPTTESPLEDPCFGKDNQTLLPSDDDCSEFILCVNGKSEIYRCPGDLLFNPNLGICDFDDDVWCDNNRTTPGWEESTASTEEIFTKCVGQSMGTSFPITSNCQQYYYCLGNNSYVTLPCPANNWYNPISGNCGPDISPEACREVLTTPMPTTSLATTVATTSTVAEKINPCEDQDVGTSFPVEADCQQYLVCLGNGKSATAQCPSNSWFDPSSADCGPNVSPTACLAAFTTTTEIPVETTTESPDDVCANQELGVSFPLPSNCQQYILCMGNGKSAVASCIYNSWYDPQTGICGPDVSPTACQETGTTTASSTSKSTPASDTTDSSTSYTTVEPDTTTNPPDISGICYGQGENQYVSYPDDCSKYVICASPVPIAFYCPENLFFNQALQKCVEWDLSDCPTTVSPGFTQPPPETSICSNKTATNLPYQENCEWFIRCIDDSSYMMGICQSGEYFDPLKGECDGDVSPDACREDFASTTATTESTTTGTTESTTLSTPSSEVDPCEGQPIGKLVPYPNDCTKFIMCIQPKPMVYDCVAGQEFSATLERCMAPWYANCSIPLTTTTHSPPTTTTTLATPSPTPDSFCFGQLEGALVPYPRNCSKYIVCAVPIPVGYACPGDEEFSPVELTCMDAEKAECNPNSFKFTP